MPAVQPSQMAAHLPSAHGCSHLPQSRPAHVHRFIGLLPRDESEDIPETLPPSGLPEVPIVDLATTTREALMQLSVASCPDPLRDLLEAQPGVLPSRVAYVTGAL